LIAWVSQHQLSLFFSGLTSRHSTNNVKVIDEILFILEGNEWDQLYIVTQHLKRCNYSVMTDVYQQISVVSL